MNAHVGLHVHEPLPIRAEITWRRLFAASAILVLTGIGILTAWRAAHPFGLEKFLLALVVTLAPAVAYAVGYFCVLPEVLGAESSAERSSLLQRWSDFARLTSAVAIIITWICWAAIIVKHFRGMVISLKQMPSMVDVFVLGALTTRPDLCVIGAFLAAALMTMCVVATEQYLVQTMEQTGPSPATGWRTAARRIVGKCGRWLGAHLCAKPALVLATGLLLFSLVARMDLFGGYGLQVISGLQSWPTAEYTLVDPALAILSQVGRWMYVAALVVALLGLATVAMRRLGDRLRRSYALVFLSTVIALFAACDLTLGVARLDSMVPSVLNVAVLGIVWILPIAIWAWRAQGDGPLWDRTRIAVMILYLPILCAGLALVPLALILVPAYACFLLGAVLLALGFTQSRREVT
ncbi:MAG: hypothetical protein ABR881_15795 [Candidatus Sulfotelmatobacter sp.]|jgi:hypothetical protein